MISSKNQVGRVMARGRRLTCGLFRARRAFWKQDK